MSWTHPLHGRGYRSPTFDNLKGDILSDKKILEYMKRGSYGEAARLRAEASGLTASTKKASLRKLQKLISKLLCPPTK